MGTFSFRRRLFLDASLINIKQAARAFSDSRRRNVAVLFTLEPCPGCCRAAVPAAVPLFLLPSIYLTPPSPYGDDLSLIEYASAISTGGGCYQSASLFRLGRCRKPLLVPAISTTPATRSSYLVPSLFIPWRRFARDHRLTGVIFALARGGHSTWLRRTTHT